MINKITITQSTLSTRILGQALKYLLDDNFSIIPCGKDKRPLLRSWKEFQTRRPSEAEVREWFNKFPEANIGIVTGKISSLTVIDIDSYAGAQDIFPATFTVKTGNGGTQKYYKYQEGITISANGYKSMPHVDLRGEGGFVVAYPSVTDYIDSTTGEKKGGAYEVIDANNGEYADFPIHLFSTNKPRKTLTELTTASKGNRNDTLASFTGRLLISSKESEWETEVWPAVARANLMYTPPLSEREARMVFESICKKELQRKKDLILSPLQLTDENNQPFEIMLRRNKTGTPHKDMANAYAVLEQHPFYKDTLKFNTFRQEIELNGKPLEDSDIIKIQYFMQTQMDLVGITKDTVFSAIIHHAQKNSYDEAQDWLKNLKWDGTSRLTDWLSKATHVDNDTYHQGIGSQWFMGLIRRIMIPGCIFDYMLVLVGAQGVGKTSLFRIIGGDWYKSYTGSMDTKDFYMALKGAIIVDLDEGATLYKSEAIKIKSIITTTHDEFRAPYDRVMKKYPRRFVFSMSTNDQEPFRDVTGNRRYWVLDVPDEMIDFKWLEDNREQLFAETYYYFVNKTKLIEVPLDEARQKQEDHLSDDEWSDIVIEEIMKSDEYLKGSRNYSTTIADVYEKVFTDKDLSYLTRTQEMRIAQILRRHLGLEKKQTMVSGIRKSRWYINKYKRDMLAKNYKNISEELIQEAMDLEDF